MTSKNHQGFLMRKNSLAGKIAEVRVRDALIKRGFIFRVQNWRASRCEIDLIMEEYDSCQKSRILCLIEVKRAFGNPSLEEVMNRERANHRKKRNMIRGARIYWSQCRNQIQTRMLDSMRFDWAWVTDSKIYYIRGFFWG